MHFSKWIVFLVLCSIVNFAATSTITLKFAQAASSVKAAGFPKSLSNASYACTQFFSKILNSSFSTITQCGRGDIQLQGSEITRSSVSTDGCSYGVWILFWFFLGCALAAIIIICCSGFGVGRTCCECCGKPCAPACGGKFPTITYPSMWVLLNLIAYLIVLGIISFLTILGFLSTDIANKSATNLSGLVPAAFEYITDMRAITRTQILGLPDTISAQVTAVNTRLSGLHSVNSSAFALINALSVLDSLVFDLQV